MPTLLLSEPRPRTGLTLACLLACLFTLPAAAQKKPTSAPPPPPPTYRAAEPWVPKPGPGPNTVAPPGTEAAMRRYTRGKDLLEAKKYLLAMTEFQSLIVTTVATPGPVTGAATYLWAVAALYSDHGRDAQPVLAALRQRLPDWGGTPDVVLLQARIAEALGDRARAREILREMPPGKLQVERDALLEQLGVGSGTAPVASATIKPVTGTLRVAALLPLNLTDPDAARRTVFAQELYAGLTLAADSLRGQGQDVQVLAYDLANDTAAATTLVQQYALTDAHLIVGPIYKAPARIIAREAAKHQIPIVNPLSEDGALLDAGPSFYLYRPSVQPQARTAARLAYERFEPKTAVLVAEDTKDDAAFAEAFRAEYQRLGGTVVQQEVIASETYRTRMTEKISDLPLDTTQTGALGQRTGVLVVASEQRNAALQVVARLERDNLAVPVIAPASWLEQPDLTLPQLEGRNFYFLAPAYRPTETPAAKRFRRAYQTRYHVPPSEFAKAGFELLYTFAPLVRQFGATGLPTGLTQRGLQPAPLLPTLGYPAGSRDNQAVSILRITNRQVEVVK